MMKHHLKSGSIGIYVRISRDDKGANFESVENQRDLLLDYAAVNQLGEVYGVYIDDNVSGSEFDRKGLERLKEDILDSRVDMVLLKDLSRLGRNNTKTLQMIDFLEECGVRLLTADGRYDSLMDNDTVGIETWVNERYVRDISRKIRSCLRFKIQRGEYLGKAPFGYRKSGCERNKLVVDEQEAYVVRMIYRLYVSGMGYTAITKYLDENGYHSPGNKGWNRITVRRILCSRVYIGDTVQGVSEKVSFKSKKTRRLPKQEWVITEGTHDAVVSRETYDEVQRIREDRSICMQSYSRACHILNGIIYCGDCGSTMYARKRKYGTAYICGNYCRNGRTACTSHFVYENEIVPHICSKIADLLKDSRKLDHMHKYFCEGHESEENDPASEGVCRRLEANRRQQEMLYRDRLEERISEQLFERMNIQLEKQMRALEREIETQKTNSSKIPDMIMLINEAAVRLKRGELTHRIAAVAVSRITVYDVTIAIDLAY